MGDLISGANLVIYVVITIGGAMFFLYSKGVEKEFDSLEDSLKEFKADSKDDDKEVKADLKEEINRRVGQTTEIHTRVGNNETRLCAAEQRVAKLEGIIELLLKEKK